MCLIEFDCTAQVCLYYCASLSIVYNVLSVNPSMHFMFTLFQPLEEKKNQVSLPKSNHNQKV